MSTLELEHIKHSSSSGNNLSVHSDGSLTLGSLNGNIHVGTMGVGHTASPTSYGDSNTMFSIHKNTTNGSVNALIGTDTVKGGMYVNNTGSDNEIKFGTVSNYPTKVMSNGVTGVEVNGNGYVTTPTQPYFYAGGNTNGTASTDTIPFNTTDYNVGNHYNTSNYTFTAPVAGNYLFTCSVLNYPNAVASGEIYFSVNGGGYSPLSRWNGIPGQASLNLSAIKKLSANDTVKVIGTLQYYVTSGHGHFSGMLLG